MRKEIEERLEAHVRGIIKTLRETLEAISEVEQHSQMPDKTREGLVKTKDTIIKTLVYLMGPHARCPDCAKVDTWHMKNGVKTKICYPCWQKLKRASDDWFDYSGCGGKDNGFMQADEV